MLLSKAATHLKPFLPQLQRTFVKALSDTTASVRSRASSALSVLLSQPIRVDPLVTELLTGIKANEGDIQETMVMALETVLKKSGSGMSDATKKAVATSIQEGFLDANGKAQKVRSRDSFFIPG